MSNDLPNLGDASGAIATRFLTLQLIECYLGREDVSLGKALAAELPGILNWALDGLDRVNAADRFTEPASSRAALEDMLAVASPMTAFVSDHCQIGANFTVPLDELWSAWSKWCEESNTRNGNKQLFGRNLRAVVPSMSVVQPRDAFGKQYRAYAGLRLKPASSPPFGSSGAWSSGADTRPEQADTRPEQADTRPTRDERSTGSDVSAGQSDLDTHEAHEARRFENSSLCNPDGSPVGVQPSASKSCNAPDRASRVSTDSSTGADQGKRLTRDADGSRVRTGRPWTSCCGDLPAVTAPAEATLVIRIEQARKAHISTCPRSAKAPA